MKAPLHVLPLGPRSGPDHRLDGRCGCDPIRASLIDEPSALAYVHRPHFTTDVIVRHQPAPATSVPPAGHHRDVLDDGASVTHHQPAPSDSPAGSRRAGPVLSHDEKRAGPQATGGKGRVHGARTQPGYGSDEKERSQGFTEAGR
jgi:hypothetical protein